MVVYWCTLLGFRVMVFVDLFIEGVILDFFYGDVTWVAERVDIGLVVVVVGLVFGVLREGIQYVNEC